MQEFVSFCHQHPITKLQLFCYFWLLYWTA